MRRSRLFANTLTLVFAMLASLAPPDLACCSGLAEMHEVQVSAMDCAESMDCCQPGNVSPAAQRCCSGDESRTNTPSRVATLRGLPSDISAELAIYGQGGADSAFRRPLSDPPFPLEPLFRLHSALLI